MNSQKPTGLSVVLPTLNEVCNIGRIIMDIRNIGLDSKSCEIVVIDDGSSDGTIELVERLLREDRSIILHRNVKRMGLAESIRLGIELSSSEFIAVMDSDGMHDPCYLPRMLQLSKQDQGLIIGSRFVSGGFLNGVLYPRLSRLVNYLIQQMLCSKVKDQLCGFFLCRRNELKEVPARYFTGFGAYFIAVIDHFETKKIPIKEIGTYQEARTKGKRKSKRFKMFVSYMRAAWQLRTSGKR